MINRFIPDKNPLFRTESEIKEICHPVFYQFDLQYFSYGRFYEDGRCVLLCTNKNVFIHHFKKQYKLTVSPEVNNSDKNIFYNLIMVNDQSPDIIIDESTLFGHGTMMDIIKKNDEFYEMFCFVSKKNSLHVKAK